MPELLKGLPQVRDGLTLIAFLSLVLLVAFKTKKVPELAFGLVRDKLTRQQFSMLLHRMLILRRLRGHRRLRGRTGGSGVGSAARGG